MNPVAAQLDLLLKIKPGIKTVGTIYTSSEVNSQIQIDILKKAGAKNIKLVCIVGVQEGIDAVEKVHPDVDIYLAAKDKGLNEISYIVPGLGDAGDRIFGTK